VAGEIPSFSVLRKGTIWALGVVGGLYLLVATVVVSSATPVKHSWPLTFVSSLAFTWNEDQLAQSYALENYAAVFLNVGNDPEKPSGMVAVATAILISISAVGSMISVAYTCVRVKQSIGWTNILPLSFYWRRSGPLQPQYQRISRDNRSDRIAVRLSLPNSNGFSYIGTPEGGIVLHWIVTVFYICVTASINSLDKAISFSANLLVYGHFFIEALVGLGFTWFKPIDLRPRPKGYPARRWFPDDDLPDRGRWMRDKDWNKFDQSPGIFKLAIKWLSSGLFQTVIGLLVAILSGVLIVLEAIPTGSPTAWGFVNLI
ncbi:high-affinity methionine permease, partial [Colletotrichum asianum]